MLATLHDDAHKAGRRIAATYRGVSLVNDQQKRSARFADAFKGRAGPRSDEVEVGAVCRQVGAVAWNDARDVVGHGHAGEGVQHPNVDAPSRGIFGDEGDKAAFSAASLADGPDAPVWKVDGLNGEPRRSGASRGRARCRTSRP